MAAKKNPALVREFLERISGSLLEDQYRHVVAVLIKGHAGVYALYKGERLYYVGLAGNLMGRVKHHLKDRHTGLWDKFSVYLTNDNAHVKPLESLLLRIAVPKGNRVKGKLVGAKDLTRQLNKTMANSDANRRATLLGGHVVRQRVKRKTASSKGTRILEGLVERRIALRADYKGVSYRATLRKDGHISYKGTLYPAPSPAAHAVVKRHVNGWWFWKYRKGGKSWVPLSKLRE